MANYTLKISPGTTLRKRVTWQSASGPIDLTGMTVIAELMDQSSGLVITLTESGGGIILEQTSGVIWLYLDATSTESLSGLGTWRLLVTETNGDVRALLCGRAEYFHCSGDVQNQSVIINQDDVITVLSGEQGPAGSIPEDRLVPDSTGEPDGNVLSTFSGIPTWISPEVVVTNLDGGTFL